MAHSAQDFRTLKNYIRFNLNWMHDQGLTLEVSHDFKAFYKAIRELPGGYREGSISPAFDYHFNRLDWSNALWLKAIDHQGITQGQVAAKIINASSLHEAYATHRFWYGNLKPVGIEEEMPVEVLSERLHDVKGLLTTGGCVWVHENRRKTNLSGMITVLARALMIKEHNSDFHTGIIKEKLMQANMQKTYQQAHIERSVYVKSWDYTMFSLWSSKEESLRHFSAVLAQAETDAKMLK